MGLIVRPHDLLLLAGGGSWEAALSDWARTSLAGCPWAVVRRALCPPGLIPVGVRGPNRSQRHAALVPTAAVIRRVLPEALRSHPRLPHLAATLSAVARLLDGVAVWGPTGGVGFELATGRSATHAASDLDVLVRAPYRWDQAVATRLAEAFAALPARVDCLLETPRGGVNLVEWSRAGGSVVARTAHGPQLVTDPWDAA
ncbi:malonate decarboxylase holo-ACP synthase [Nonomuraea terrae]|uniref:Malonate decarboxylase holo-ACP synthase n=1 Tax=Nonomuraea terrae TaxID=2530383 RepID=A0A4R4YQN6_9ACTN|nr:malonate decarboxylase holo-ACP synthase [Nonomuraea terrae]TDD47525.1 malonate decarboxylase holo-ACP synthase [Nonomuraea terrae]